MLTTHPRVPALLLVVLLVGGDAEIEEDRSTAYFPANGVTHEEGHAFCSGGKAPAVMAFLREAMAM